MCRSLSATVLFVSIAAAVPAAAATPLRVVTSIETLASLAQEVGGPHVSVTSLSRGYQDPHFVEAKPSLLVTLAQADFLVYVGLDLESGWLPPLVTGCRNGRIQPGADGDLDASTAIDTIDLPAGKVDRGQGDIHPLGNPHYWLPPVNALKVAKEIASRLSKLDPAHSADYMNNLQKLGAELKALAPEWSRKAASLKGTKVVTYHKSWSYVSRWLGLDEVGYVEDKPGIAPDPKHLAELVVRMRSEGVKLILIESFHNRSIAEQVADASGAKMVVLASDVGATPRTRTYFDVVDALLDALTAAAKS